MIFKSFSLNSYSIFKLSSVKLPLSCLKAAALEVFVHCFDRALHTLCFYQISANFLAGDSHSASQVSMMPHMGSEAYLGLMNYELSNYHRKIVIWITSDLFVYIYFLPVKKFKLMS